MRFRRALVVVDLGADPRGAVDVARRIAPGAERIVAVARQPSGLFASLSAALAPARVGEGAGAVERLRDALSGAAREVDVAVVLAVDADALTDAVQASGAEVLVAGALPFGASSAIAEVRRRTGTALVWAGGTPAPERPGLPIARLLCPVIGGGRALAALGPFLRDRCGPEQHVTVLALGRPPRFDAAATVELAGITAAVEVIGAGQLTPETVAARARAEGIDLVVVTRLPPAPVLDVVARFAAPVLVLPPAAVVPPERRAPLDVPDLVDDGSGTVRVRLAQTGALGRPVPIPEERVAFVAAGRIVWTGTSRAGEIELPASTVTGAVLGVARVHPAAADPLAAIERAAAVLRPGDERLVLLDGGLEPEALRTLAKALADAPGHRAVAVRLRTSASIRSIRRRIAAAGLDRPAAVDASAVLGEGDPEDVPEVADAVRLARVAARMRGAGFAVDAVAFRGPHAPAAHGFSAYRADELARAASLGTHGRADDAPVRRRPPPRDGSLSSRLDAVTPAEPFPGNRVEVGLDNAIARRHLLEHVQGARRRVHVQAYIVADDDVTREIEGALAAAAARGVEVRVLVDSVYSLHGSFGRRNPLLERLAGRGVEVRASRPIAGLPSLEELKQRDHRKLVVVDGAVGLVGGRNLAREYYLGFDEARLTARSTWRDVPWLDAGARVEGPAVAELDRAFLEAWTVAGGDAFEVVEPPPAGRTPARVVVHRGLCDAYTLEVYLALIETARSHLYVVNTFPLQLEVQRALLRAVGRGVAVRVLAGNVLPLHGAEPFGGAGSSLRALATQLVHARMDALVAAGAEGYQFSVRGVRGWDPALGEVRPHVHAKVVSADGLAFAVGSANLDITAGYWESELALVVEEAALARALEARLQVLVAGSVRVDRSDPEWQRLAARRGWLSRHWPALVG